MKSSAAVAVPTLARQDAALLVPREFDETSERSARTKRAASLASPLADYVVDVSRPDVGWRWTRVLLAPLEWLAVAWAIPFVILVIGLPIVLVVALVHWIGRLALNQF